MSAVRRRVPLGGTDRFSHWPHNPVPGESVTITFTNAKLAGQTVKVTIMADLQPYATVEIVLNETGTGAIETTCPNGDVVTLSHPTSLDHLIVTA